MSAIGRNQPCRCGSRKKTKHCCGVPHGPCDSELAKAFLATEASDAARRLIRLPEDELHDLFDEMLDLPERHLSLQLPLPKLLPPDLETLRYAIDDDDPDAADEHLGPALKRVDNPLQRAGLARAVLALADSGAIDPAVADAAILDLDSHGTSCAHARQPAPRTLRLRRRQPNPRRAARRIALTNLTGPTTRNRSRHTPPLPSATGTRIRGPISTSPETPPPILGAANRSGPEGLKGRQCPGEVALDHPSTGAK